MKIGTSQLLAGFKHIHMLNGYVLPKDKNTVFKYMSLERFLQSINNGELIFVSPEMWYDPFEQLYFKINCSSKGYTTDEMACMCISEKSSTNEDACWRVYGDSNGKTVRVSIEYNKLLTLLDEYSDRENCDVYLGRVNYSFERKEIENLHLPSSKHYNEYFPAVMSREHYLSLMLLKRKAFCYENEVRIFIVKKKLTFDDKKLLHITCDYKKSKIVSNVMLAPYPPVRSSGDVAFAVRKKINLLESNELKRVLQGKLECRIQQSRLYEVCEKDIIV